MNHLGEEVFAGAGLAEEEEIDIVIEDFLDRLQERSASKALFVRTKSFRTAAVAAVP